MIKYAVTQLKCRKEQAAFELFYLQRERGKQKTSVDDIGRKRGDIICSGIICFLPGYLLDFSYVRESVSICIVVFALFPS